jgi:hypothetical protein
MNIYEHSFAATCPNNGLSIGYKLRIKTSGIIMVEDIIEACKVDSEFHEKLADKLHSKFGGKQIITAVHHGVKIKSIRQ